ncbi:MAG: hypothetical protein A2Y38_21235 [Spirochaetes bacterium GWB1_59_5]|nr:MAG: hypothetical protein A2Y38_21235 [Spirochaetes bacterium GWB1_59_5]
MMRLVFVGFILATLHLGCRAKPLARFEWEAKGTDGNLMGYVGAVAVAPDGKVWVAEASGRFFIFDADGAFIEVWGEPGTGPGQFRFIHPPLPGESTNIKFKTLADILFLPDGSFYVMEPANNRIQRFSVDRRLIRAWGSGLGVDAAPTGMALRGADELLVSFQRLHEIQRFSLDGDFLGAIDLGLDQPTSSLAVDGDRTIFVATQFPPQDGVNPRGRLLVFEPDGKPRRTLGLSQEGFVGLSFEHFIDIDEAGRCVVSDEWMIA